MPNTAEQTAHNAETTHRNDPGMCLQQSRTWAGIPAVYPDATTAWKNTNDRHPQDRNPPRGSAVYWTGGSQGFGHIAISLGNGRVRSTDACGSGCTTTVDLGWVERSWGLPYAGWSWDINEQTIIHDEPKPEPPPEDEMPEHVKITLSKQSVPKDTWVAVEFDKTDAADAGTGGLKIGGKKAVVVFSAQFDFTSGDTARTRFVERNQIDGKWKTAKTHPVLEHPRTSGSTYTEDTNVVAVGKDHRLGVEVYLPDGGALAGGSLSALYF